MQRSGCEMEAIGVDIGGSGVRVGRVDVSTGEVLGEILRRPHGGQEHCHSILGELEQLLERMPEGLPVGLGFPGVVKGTRVHTAPNLHPSWAGMDLAVALRLANLSALNDADAAAEAERSLGAARGESGTVLTLTIGTGLGSAVHRKGVLVPNLELGLLPHPTRGGLIETHASGRARREEGLDLRAWAARLQEALDLYEGWLNPGLIVLAGGITESWEQWSDWLTTRATLRKARFGADAGLIGAAIAATAQRD